MKIFVRGMILVMIALTAFAAATDDLLAPRVVSTFPASGSTDVDPTLTELKVTFDEPMAPGGYAFAHDGIEKFPEVTDLPYFLDDQATAVLPIVLEPNTRYEIWINTTELQSFKGQSGIPAVPFFLSFETASLDSAK